MKPVSDLSHLPPLRDVISVHDLRAEKSLGQNFLLDLNVTAKIVRSAGDLAGAHVIEIGPGPGGLTRALLESEAARVSALEFDPRAVAALGSLQDAAGERLQLIHADALERDLTALTDEPRAIVANLPYNIATPLLVGWLRQIYENNAAFRSMTLMFQKEVAQRICAASSTKAYGRLAVLSQWLCEAKIVMDLPPAAFTPPPKVTSSVVHFRPRLRAAEDTPDFKMVEKITAAAFGQRRKMIRSSLKDYMYAVEACRLDETLRAENLSVGDFLAIARAV